MKRLVILVVLCCASSAHAEEDAPRPSRAQVGREVSRLATDGTLPFCTDPKYEIPRDDRPLCELAEEARGRCSGLAEACARPSGPAPADPEQEARARRQRLALGEVGQLLFWGVAVAGAVLLLLLLVRAIVWRRASNGSDAALAQTSTEAEDGQPRAVADLDAGRLLARARAAADAREFDEAVSLCYAALLVTLAERGLIDLRPWRANGEYVAALRELPAEQALLRGVVKDVDRIHFGARRADPSTFEAVWQKVTSLVAAAPSLILVVVLALASSGCRELVEAGQRASSDRAPGGHALLQELLRAHGKRVSRRVRPVDEIGADVTTAVVLTEQTEDGWQVLLDWAEAGGTLVVAVEVPPAAALVAPWLGQACDEPTELAPGYRDDEFLGPARVALPRDQALQARHPETWPIVRCSERMLVAARDFGSGLVIFAASADLLSNAALVAADNAYVWIWLLDPGEGRVEILDDWTGAGASSPLESIKRGRLTPIMVQILLWMLVFLLFRGRAFGRLRDPIERSRRAFADHVRALGLVYFKARATRLVLGAYAGWALDRLRERTRPGRGDSLVALAQAVSERTGRSEAQVMRVLVEARSAQEEGDRKDHPNEDLATMRQLESLLQQSGGIR